MRISRSKLNLSNFTSKEIEKSYTEGVYSNSPINRKLGRVGMSYGHSLNLEGFKDVEDSGEGYVSNPKQVLKRASKLLSDRAFKLVKDLMEREGFHQGDIYANDGKISFNTIIEVSPEKDKDIINLGEKKETQPQKEQDYYKFIRETWSPEQLEEKWLNTFEKEESWGKVKYYSMLVRLKIEQEQRQWALYSAKHDLWGKLYDEGKVSGDSDSSDISDYEAEKYIKIHGEKYEKDNLAYNSKHKAFIDALMDYGIDFYQTERDNMDKFKEQFKEYFITCPRNDFYQMVKGCSVDPPYMNNLLELRFAFKYNKMLAGRGWDDILTKDGKIDIKKRDEVLELCKQIEYAVDDVLGDDKDLFINNPNIDFIRFDKNIDWGGASYNKNEKVITITSEYFQSMKENRKNNKRAGTLAREKFMVEGFIHEIGHSLDVTADIYDSDAYKDFARHLGYDKNRLYTIYTNAINEASGSFDNQDYYLSIEKDKKDELIKKFGPLYEAYFGKIAKFNDRELKDIFLSEYSSKSASEGFAEYFSFYMGNKKYLDKQIAEYKKNPKEYLPKAEIGDWYKYSVYGGKWKVLFSSIPDRYKDSEGSKALKKYYGAVIEHNLEMLEDIQKIVKMAKKNMKS